MRILVVSHPRLSPQYGAAQIALNLAGALADRGHDAVAWSPEPFSPKPRWWEIWRHHRQALERFLEESDRFDVIDVPAVSITSRVARAGIVVARNVQPEILYLAVALRWQLRRGSGVSLPRFFMHAAHSAEIASAVLGGWRRARFILCLGSRELCWMRRRFPRWQTKLRRYVLAPSPAEQEAFAEVRRHRLPHSSDGVRFLWMGRWAPHKGPDVLVAFLRERASLAPNDTFTLAGCGPAAERDCPQDLVAAGRLRIIPFFQREELPVLLAEHDAGLFTSGQEGWGLTLNEMLESGLPVFATPAGGVEDLRPFWGSHLQPFPPPAETVLPAGPAAEPTDYLREFSWPAIARRYEEDILAACEGAQPCIRS